MKQIIKTPNAPAPIGPYSQAVLYNGTLYGSGQIAINPRTGDIITGTIEDETRMVMENIKAVLSAAEMDFTNIIKVSIFLKDLNHFNKVNEIYGTYFKDQYPARETVQVARLPKDVNIEISFIAS
jgi:2-iminobutanoate/2-iminopropanoate deaminase